MRRRPGPKGGRRPNRPLKGPPKKRPPRQLNPRLQKELRRANHLMRNGEHANAAKVFISLGENAQDRGILKPAAFLFLQAAMALLMSNQSQAAIVEGKKGLQILANNGRWDEFQFERQKLSRAFSEAGEDKLGDEFEAIFENQRKPSPADGPAPSQREKSKMPAKCPYCGASLSLEQISSGREQAAECKYCGSVVVAGEIS